MLHSRSACRQGAGSRITRWQRGKSHLLTRIGQLGARDIISDRFSLRLTDVPPSRFAGSTLLRRRSNLSKCLFPPMPSCVESLLNNGRKKPIAGLRLDNGFCFYLTSHESHSRADDALSRLRKSEVRFLDHAERFRRRPDLPESYRENARRWRQMVAGIWRLSMRTETPSGWTDLNARKYTPPLVEFSDESTQLPRINEHPHCCNTTNALASRRWTVCIGVGTRCCALRGMRRVSD